MILKAEVIPVVRLPRHIAWRFSYTIPEGPYKIGDAVRIPFRGRLIFGVIDSLEPHHAQTQDRPLAEVESLAPLPVCLRHAERAWWLTLARQTYTSLGSIAYASMPPWPKKEASALPVGKPFKSVEEQKYTADETKEALAILEAIKGQKPGGHLHVSCTWLQSPWLAIVGRVKQTQRFPAILVPDIDTAHAVASACAPHMPTLVWTGSQSAKAKWAAWNAWRTGSACVVATRVATGTLPAATSDLWVLRAGEDDYLQADQQPHWDARMLAQAHAAQSKGIATQTCVLPRIEDGDLTHDFWQSPLVEVVDTERDPRKLPLWFLTSEAKRLLSTCSPDTPPVYLYWNRVAHESHSIEHIAEILRQAYPTSPLTIIRPGTPLPSCGIAIGTRALFSRLPSSRELFIGLVFLFADVEWAARDFRSMERAARLLRTAASLCARRGAQCLVQTKDTKMVRRMLGPTKEWFESELADRKLFQYPPFFDHISYQEKDGHVQHRLVPHHEVQEDLLTLPPSSVIVKNQEI